MAYAEDAVQSAWLKASRADHDTIENLTGWFTTITACEALDELRAHQWQAKPSLADTDPLERVAEATIAGADEGTLLTDSVSGALLVVLAPPLADASCHLCAARCFPRCPSTPSANC